MTIIIASLLVIVSAMYYIGFTVSEGKDERGREILKKSSQIAFVFIMFGFVFQAFYFEFASPSIEQVQILITVWMALEFVCNSISIIVLQIKS